MNKILFLVSIIGLVFSMIFTIASIWNNTDWQLLERGYYTFGIITVAVSMYLSIQFLSDFSNSEVLAKINTFIVSTFSIVAVIFMVVSVRNTEWVLLEKGYYWMGIGFVSITSSMVSATIKGILDSPQKYME